MDARLVLGALASSLLVAALFVPPAAVAHALEAESGHGPILPTEPGMTLWRFKEHRVVLVTMSEATMDTARQTFGPEATTTLTTHLRPGLEFAAFHGQSTHMGCTVGWNADLTAGADALQGRLMDACHQGTWNIYAGGKPMGGPNGGPLAQLDLFVKEHRLYATGFDGPVGAQNL